MKLTKNVRKYSKANIKQHLNSFNNGDGSRLTITTTDSKIKGTAITGAEVMEAVYGEAWKEFVLTHSENIVNGKVTVTGEEIAKAINAQVDGYIVDGRHGGIAYIQHSLIVEKSNGSIKLSKPTIKKVKCETYAHYYELAVQANAGNDSVTGTDAEDKKLQALELYSNMSDTSKFVRSYAQRVLGVAAGKAQDLIILCKHTIDFGLDREKMLKLNRNKLGQLNKQDDKKKGPATKSELADKLDALVAEEGKNAPKIMSKTNIEELSKLAVTVESKMQGILEAILGNDFNKAKEAVKSNAK